MSTTFSEIGRNLEKKVNAERDLNRNPDSTTCPNLPTNHCPVTNHHLTQPTHPEPPTKEEALLCTQGYLCEKFEHIFGHSGNLILGDFFKLLAKGSALAKHYIAESAHGAEFPIIPAATRVATDTAAVSALNAAFRAAGIVGSAGPLAGVTLISELVHAVEKNPRLQESLERVRDYYDPFSARNTHLSPHYKALLVEGHLHFEMGRVLFKLMGVPASALEKLGTLVIDQSKILTGQIKNTSSKFFSGVHDYMATVFSRYGNSGTRDESEAEMEARLQGMREADRKRELDKYHATLESLRPFVEKLTAPLATKIAGLDAAIGISELENKRSAESKRSSENSRNAPNSENTTNTQISDNTNLFELAQFLLKHGASLQDTAAAIQQSEVVSLLQEQLQLLRAQDAELQRQRSEQEFQSAIRGGERICNTLIAAGTRLECPALITAGKTGVLALQMYSGIKQYSNLVTTTACLETFSGMLSLVEPVSLMVAAAFGFMELFSSNDSGQAEALRIAEIVRGFSQRLDQHMEIIHGRLDAIEGGIAHLGGLLRISLQNQAQIYQLQRATYELVGKCFNIMSHRLQDLQSENKSYFERLFSGIRYLVNSDDLKELRDYQSKIQKTTDAIIALDKLETTNEIETQIKRLRIIELFSKLSSYIEQMCSPSWNGALKYAAIKEGPDQSPEECSQFLLRRFKKEDYALGPLADEFEEITKTDLLASGIDKKLLFSNVLWKQGTEGYLTLSNLPSLKRYDCKATVAFIEKQAENALKFMNHIGKCELLFKNLSARHQALCYEFQLLISQLVAGKPYKGSTNSLEKRDMLDQYFANGMERAEINKVAHKIDKNYLLLKQFARLGGLSSDDKLKIDALSTSATLLQQEFSLADLPTSTEYAQHLRHGYFTFDENDPSENQNYTGFETVGGKLIETEGTLKIFHLMVSNHKPTQGLDSGRVMIDMGQYDVRAHKTNRTVFDSYNGSQSLTPPIPYEYKTFVNPRRGCIDHFDVRQAWSATHYWEPCHLPEESMPYSPTSFSYKKVKEPHFVFMTAGFVSVFDATHKKWVNCNNNRTPASYPILMQVYGGIGQVNKTHNSVIVHDYLIVNIFDWTSSKDKVTVNFNVFDLIRKFWLQKQPQNIHCPFPNNNNFFIEKSYFKSPNQIFIQNVENEIFSSVPGFIMGILVAGERLSLNIVQKRLPNPRHNQGYEWSSTYYKKNWKMSPWTKYNIPSKEINQVKSEVFTIDGVKHLFVVASVKTNDNSNKLIILNQSVSGVEYNAQFDHFETILPSIQEIPDLQGMLVSPLKLGEREYLMVTILNPDYQFLVFCYDPYNKKLMELPPGPVAFNEPPIYREKQKRNPGFYPISCLAINVVYERNMAMLYFTFPVLDRSQSAWPKWKMNNVPYKLGPLLKASFEASKMRVTPVGATPVVTGTPPTPASTTGASLAATAIPVMPSAIIPSTAVVPSAAIPSTAVVPSTTPVITPPQNLLSLSILGIQLLAKEQRIRIEQQIQTPALVPTRVPDPGDGKIRNEESQILGTLRSELSTRDEQLEILREKLAMTADSLAITTQKLDRTNLLLENMTRMLGMNGDGTRSFVPQFSMPLSMPPASQKLSQPHSASDPGLRL